MVEFRYNQIIFLRLSVILLTFTFTLLKLHIQSPVEQLRLSFFVEIINVLKPLVIFAGELHRGCFKGDSANNLLHSSKTVSGTFQHWSYPRESWTPPAS